MGLQGFRKMLREPKGGKICGLGLGLPTHNQ